MGIETQSRLLRHREQFEDKMNSPIYGLDQDRATYLSMKVGAELGRAMYKMLHPLSE